MIRGFFRPVGFSVASNGVRVEGTLTAAREANLSHTDAAISFFTS